MRRKIFFIGLAFLMLFTVLWSHNFQTVQAVSLQNEKTLVLYDASSGNIPDSSLIGFTAFPPDGASLQFENDSSVFDTTISGSDTYAGWVAGAATTDGFPILDSTAGFRVNFALQVERESHDSAHRSGFSVIILDSNARGIEMSFWPNEIWVQHDDTTGGLFTHGEGVSFATTEMLEYEVRFSGDQYALTANSQPLLAGPLRDYSAFDRFPDPYETPNFLFLGDDTTSAETRARLRFLSVTGTQLIAPTSVMTVTSTNLPLPTLTATSFLTSTTIPSPTQAPVNPTGSLCPSGWLLAVVMAGNVALVKSVQRRSKRN